MKIFLILLLGSVAAVDHDLLVKYTKGNLKFSANVYKEMLKTSSGNFLICPTSVEIVFALMHAGAKHKTANQISTGFGFPHETEKIQDVFGELTPRLQHTGNYNISSANKVYIKNGFKIKDHFKKVATKAFKAEVEEIDFDKKENAVNQINDWVEENTLYKIHNILTKDDITDDTRMVLVNAMYFKANWLNEFHESNTKKRNFYLNSKNTVDVEMMELTKSFRYHECNETDSKYLAMRFLGTDITMTIILPNNKEGLAHLEENLEKTLDEPKYKNEKVHVRLPKFEMGSKIEFKPILEQLGVVDAFKDTADFSGINANPNEALKVDKVIQKTYIKVEEKGTTAAAATAVISVMTSSLLVGPPPPPPKEFFADHPFIYVLRNEEGILFVGRYVSNEN